MSLRMQGPDHRGDEFSRQVRSCLGDDNVLRVRKGDLRSSAIDALFDNFIGAAGALEVRIAGELQDDLANLQIAATGTGLDGVFKGLDVAVLFTLQNGVPHIAIRGSTPEGWTLASSLPALAAHPLIARLPFARGSQLFLTSYRVSEAVPEGLYFSGSALPVGPLGPLAFLTGETTPQPMRGSITFKDGMPEVDLVPSAADDAASQLHEMGFLTRTRVAVGIRTSARPHPMRKRTLFVTAYSISTAIVFRAGSREHRIPLEATYHGSGRVTLRSNLTAIVDVTFDQLKALADNADLAPLLKDLRDFRLSDVLRLQDLVVTVDLRASKVESVQFGVESAHPFTLVHDPTHDTAIVLETVYLSFLLIAPATTRTLHAQLGGRLRIGRGALDVVAAYPSFEITISETPRGRIFVREVFALLTGDESGVPPDLRVSEFEMVIVPGAEYSVDVEVEGNWPIDLAGLQLAIDELQLSLDHEPGKDTKIVLSGRFELGGLHFGLAANRPSSDAGWEFSGFTLDDEVIKLSRIAEDLLNMFLLDPDVRLPELDVWNVNIAVKPHTKQFSFGCESLLKIGATELDAVIDIDIDNSADTFEQRFSGELKIGTRQFDLILDRKTEETFFIASYKSAAGDTIRIAEDLIAPLAPDLAKALPQNLTISLQDVLFAYESAAASRFLLGADIGTGIDLSNLPLVGRAFPAGQPLRLTFQPVVAKGDFKEKDIRAIRALVPEGGLSLPEREIKAGFSLATSLQLGDRAIDLSLPFSVDKKSGKLEEDSTKPEKPSDDALWISLQKTFGPVHFERIGVRFDQGDLWFLLDASLSAAGLTLALDGLSAGVALSDIRDRKFNPKFALRGLGIDYKNSAVEIGGFLAHLPPAITGGADEYDGFAVIRTSKLSLSAIGSYAELNGDRSLFLYAVLDYPIGGPTFFFVTGLAAGFGYNRGLLMPPVEKIAEFPLISAAVGGSKSLPASATGGEQRELLTRQLSALREYVPIEPGKYFFAIGVHFTSFKLVDSFALLAVSFGQHVEIDVLGLSTAVIPTPDASRNVEPLAELQLALRATFLPAEGVLAITAVLTKASYVFSRDCHLTGGFAFHTWFSGEHAGDFVLTVGGYHPSYRPPAHYPTVPRLGFNWQVTKELSVKGEAYFALTSNALMAGAHLEAIWESGPLRAWFRAGANFLVAWKPYYYEAAIYVDLGASYTFELFGTQHITAELGADLHVWGPDFAGRAEIHWYIISFTISFGEQIRRPPALLWSEFRDSFLPHATDGASDGVCTIAARAGLLRRAQDAEQHELWIVNPKDLVLVTNSLIPATEIVFGTQRFDHAHYGAAAIGIAPMNARQDAVRTTHTIEIERGGEPCIDDFEFVPVLKRAPMALWGESMSPDLNGAPAIEATLSGFEVRPRTRAEAGSTHAIERERLQFDTQVANAPPQPATFAHFRSAEKQERADIRNGIVSAQTTEARAGLLRALGFDPVADVVGLTPATVDELWAAPIAGAWHAES